MSNRVKKLTTASLLTATICVSSMLSVNIMGIPFSFALFGVFLSGLILSPLFAFTANVAYILIGLVGIPVFANFNGGLSAIFGASGGFIISYPFVAVTVSLLVSKSDRIFYKQFIACLLSLVLCYFIGVVWYSFVYSCGIIQSLLICVLPFVIIDIFKIFLSCFVARILLKHIKK